MQRSPHFPSRLRATIALPASKSLSNRALLLCAVSGGRVKLENLSDCDDTRVMVQALADRPATVDILAAGTAMRFLTAFFAATPGADHVMTGTERMRQRPIGVLVDALRRLGADIAYEAAEGYPPLRIKGRTLQGGRLSLAAGVSSQYVSALLMTAPLMTEGLTLVLEGEIISRPYIEMTRRMIADFGGRCEWIDDHTLHVAPGLTPAQGLTYTVESDWSAASYWYEAVALTADAGARLTLPHLHRTSLQGDSAVQRFFSPLGVVTRFDEATDSVILSKATELTADTAPQPATPLTFDLSGQPDLAQTLVVTCAMLRRPFRFTGLKTLRIKETDRIAALTAELAKYGLAPGVEGDDALYLTDYPAWTPHYDGRPIATYADHRMALAFAPTALCCEGVTIADAEVVSKSYPSYWQTLEELPNL